MDMYVQVRGFKVFYLCSKVCGGQVRAIKCNI